MRKLELRQNGTAETGDGVGKTEDGQGEGESDQDASGDDDRVPEAVAGHIQHSEDEGTPKAIAELSDSGAEDGHGVLDEEEMMANEV
jgi:hypothetical protein